LGGDADVVLAGVVARPAAAALAVMVQQVSSCWDHGGDNVMLLLLLLTSTVWYVSCLDRRMDGLTDL